MDWIEDTVTSWPVHEVGRNPDLFDPDGDACSERVPISTQTVIALQRSRHYRPFRNWISLPSEGYEPKHERATRLGNGVDISIAGNQDGQELHATECSKAQDNF